MAFHVLAPVLHGAIGRLAFLSLGWFEWHGAAVWRHGAFLAEFALVVLSSLAFSRQASDLNNEAGAHAGCAAFFILDNEHAQTTYRRRPADHVTLATRHGGR